MDLIWLKKKSFNSFTHIVNHLTFFLSICYLLGTVKNQLSTNTVPFLGVAPKLMPEANIKIM